MATYLITGAAGFIAARVAEMLLEAGHRVVGVDNLNDAYDVRIKRYRLEGLNAWAGFSFHAMDISDWEAVQTLANNGDRFDGVINLAARAGVRTSLENPWVYVETNITGTLNLLELCQRSSIPKFILASTSSVYGADAPLPTPESAGSDRPLQAYAASKKGAEALAHAYHHLYGTDVTVVRFFTVYGPAGRPDMSIFRFIRWIAEGEPLHLNGDGEQSRGFTYIDDIARGVILALKPLGYEIINLGGHENISINALIALLETKLGRKAQVEYHPFHSADMLSNLADVSKANELLGWKAVVDLEQGLTQTIDWYHAHRSWARKLDIS